MVERRREMLEILMLGVAAGGIGGGYVAVRRFVRERLRFIDGVGRTGTAVGIGVIAALAASPVTWVLPVVGAGTAMLFGAGVGLGIAHGARDIRARDRLLPPL
jgi:hypothetical protein